MTTQIKLASIESTALNTLQGPRITSVQVDVDSGYTSSTANAVGLSGGYISINGSGFVTGCTVIIGSQTATSVTFVSSIKVNCQVPAQSAGTYTVYLVNPDGSTAIRVNSVQYSSTPSWVTSGTQSSVNPISLQLSATSDTTVSYALQAGSSLPSGMTLTSGGLLSGSVTGSGTTTYNFTIVATDVELQYTPQAFSVTISFTEPYFNLTTVAINSDNNGTGTIISDASTNAFELTVAGTPRATNFTPFGTGWSNYFSGTSDYVTTTSSSSAFTFGTGDWTVEMWINTITFGNRGLFQTSTTSGGMLASAGGGGIQIYLTTGATIGVSINSTWTNTATTAMVTGVWYHIALVKSSNNVKLYVNGVADSGFGTVSDTTNYTATYACYGGYYSASYLCNSYISNLRVVKGTAVYTGNFTPSTSVLTAVANTSYLVCQSNRFVDNSTNAITQIINGAPTIQSFNPFNLTNTGSDGVMYFSGTSDYITLPSSSSFTFGTGDFTIEGWYYLTAAVSSTKYFFDGRSGGQNQAAPALLMTSSTFSYYVSGAYGGQSGTPVINSWSHVAVVRISAVTKLYVNGQQQFSFSDSTNYTSSTMRVGSEWSASGSYDWQGYISNFRVVKGTGVYTGAFTPPAVALTATQSSGTNIAAISSGTSLLTLQNKYSHNTTQGHQDSSTNQLLITSAGSPAAGNFTPFSQNGWSNYFNGSTDHLSISTATPLVLAGSVWTIECWCYLTSSDFSSYRILVNKRTSGSAASYDIFFNQTNGYLAFYNGTQYTSSVAPVAFVWNHVAAVYDGTNINLFMNGTRVLQTATTNPDNGGSIWIGVEADASTNRFIGYISNIRILKGTGLYSGTTYTLPTSALTAITNTVLLTCQSNRFADSSTNSYTVTPSGTPSVQAFSPFAPTAAYSQSTVGGSVYTGTTSDWITVANSNSLKLSTSDFTIECWIYFMNPNSQTYYGIVGKRTADSSTGYLLFGLNSSFGLILLASSNGSGWDIANSSGSTALKKNAWYHVALVRSGSSIKAYLNGALEITVTSSAAIYDNTAALSIGNWSETQSSYPFIGYISNFRFQIGVAQYTTTFTAPASLVTATANTNVLVNSISTALTDVSSRNNMITTSLAKISTGLYKYGTGSMFFGSGNYITVPSSTLNAFGAGDFTIETWIYLTSVPADTCIIDGRDGTGTAVKPCIFIQQSSSNFIFYVNGSIRIQGGTYSLSTWQHVAVCRSSGSTKMFVAGTQVGSTYTDANSYLACAIRIGYFNDGSTTVSFNGYMDDLRITRYARYTANFTAPTTTFIAR